MSKHEFNFFSAVLCHKAASTARNIADILVIHKGYEPSDTIKNQLGD